MPCADFSRYPPCSKSSRASDWILTWEHPQVFSNETAAQLKRLISGRVQSEYLYPTVVRAVVAAFPAVIGDFDDVPAILAEQVHRATAGAAPWAGLPEEVKRRKVSQTKKRLNTGCVDQMNAALLAQVDPKIRRDILAPVFRSKNATPGRLKVAILRARFRGFGPSKMPPFIQQLWRDRLDVVFPRSCVHCGGIVEGGRFRHLCLVCERQLVVVKPPHCNCCGHPYFGEMEANRVCPHCELLAPKFGEGKTAVLLKGAGRTLVHALKYHHGLQVLEDIGVIMGGVPGYLDYLRGAVLVPVPLHPKKMRQRLYNQSRLLADCAARAAGASVRVEELLRRVVHTESQTHYDRDARQKNLKNAFALAPGATINPALRYVLVDDVFTTGSTLNACASVLRRGGALNLDVVTFGHG